MSTGGRDDSAGAAPRRPSLYPPATRTRARREARDRLQARAKSRQLSRRERRRAPDALCVGGWPASSVRLNRDAPESVLSRRAHRTLMRHLEQSAPERLREQWSDLAGSLYLLTGPELPAAFARLEQLDSDIAEAEARLETAEAECAAADRQLIEAEARLEALAGDAPATRTSESARVDARSADADEAHNADEATALEHPTVTAAARAARVAHARQTAARAAWLRWIDAGAVRRAKLLNESAAVSRLHRLHRILVDSVQTAAPPALCRGTRAA